MFNNKLWALGTSDDKVWSSDDGVTWTEVLAGQGTRFSGRNGVGSVVFDNRLWVIGGFENGSFNYKNDVWSSDDGANWTLETGAAGFSARRPYGNVVVFAGKIWVIGGQVSNGFINDVWSSSDGKTWTQAADAPFSARSGHRVVVFGNGIWVIGGNSNGTYQNDVWQYGQ